MSPKVVSRFPMWHFPHLQPRPSLRLVARMSAGALVPLCVAPALAQGVSVGIAPATAIAPRAEREKQAPAVMAPATPQASEASQAERVANELAWSESLKRLREAETSEPSRALSEYKRFFSERALSPELGVQVGLKVAELRLQMGDAKGALQTCEVLAAKYADEPSAALFALQKARVLMESKQLAEASRSVNDVMPSLVALGPSRYLEISDVLLKLVQANLDGGEAGGKERARALCVDLEEVYLRWTKKDAVDHLWQRFEALQTKYQEAGDEKRADELLPKVGDLLLKTPVEVGYIEGAVLSLESARWFKQHGHQEQSSFLYERVPKFGDGWHTILARYDQALPLMNLGQFDEARAILSSPLDATVRQYDGGIAQNVWLASLEYQQGNLEAAFRLGKKVKETVSPDSNSSNLVRNLYQMGSEIYSRAGGWKEQAIQTKIKEIVFRSNPLQSNQPLYARFRIKTYGDNSVTATVDNPAFQARVLPINNWQHNGLNTYEQEMEVVVQTSINQPTANASLVLSSAMRGQVTTVRLSLVGETTSTAA